ncbi:uncharacterized protein LOC129914591 [Episyrphus balteatus]|uniref:uncharacterized protein LOC129914591 n=1 Tax=Episyrphus balteatus TaxID=286459 RepID=UPI00248576A8|nr:uncharacterized protein LOC129914591 [Episyrphus balteatus]
MDNNIELQTPKNKLRSLGLRRNTPKANIPKTPLSDIKINYKSLQSETEVSSPITPKLRQTLSSTASSTNCLPYRLSLSRGAREKYKKKKLEFAANQLALDVQNTSELKQEETTKEKQLQRHRKHQEKVKELESVIAVWKEAFKTSLEELSSKIEPKMETEDLIARLGIPPDMIDYT